MRYLPLVICMLLISCSPIKKFTKHKQKLKDLSEEYGYTISKIDTIRDTLIITEIAIEERFTITKEIVRDTLRIHDTLTNTKVRVIYKKLNSGAISLDVKVDKPEEVLIKEYPCEKEQFVISELEVLLRRWKRVGIISIIVLLIIIVLKTLKKVLWD